MPRRTPGGAGAGVLTATGFRLGWRAVRWLPEGPAQTLFEAAAGLVHRRGGPGAAQLRANLRRAVPDAGEEELDALVAAGLRSYARYWCDAFRLPSWSPERLQETLRVVGDEPVRRALDSGRGVVGVLAHLANWDHAGAWSQAHLAPVVTVAERLRPAALHEQFVGYRRRLGMEVLPLGDPTTFGVLARRLRAGAFVPLLADRDLSGTGVEVQLLGEPARMAAGPAALALSTGAALVPVLLHHEPLPPGHPGRRAGARHGVVATFAPEVRPPAAAGHVRGRQERAAVVRAMTQACADALSAGIAAHPEDWHVLQPVFTADLAAGPARGGPDPRAEGGR